MSHTVKRIDEMEAIFHGSFKRAAAELEVDGERATLDPGCMARVGAGTSRKLYAGAEGARVLALGGTPGRVYARPDDFKLGAPDPTVAHADARDA